MEEYMLKTVVIGDMCVGKTCLLLRYCDDMFQESHKLTIGVDFKIRNLERKNCSVKLQLWDTSGMDRFRTIVSSFYRGADGVIIVYDVTDRSSFEKVPWWHQEAKYHTRDACLGLLVGNKTDLESMRVVSTREGEKLAKSLGMRFMEASAKNGKNVTKTMDTLVDAILDSKNLVSADMLRSYREASGVVDIKATDVEQSSWCSGDLYSCTAL